MAVPTQKGKNVKAPLDLTDAKNRTCLRCNKIFASSSRANRICPHCRSLKARG